MANDKGVVWITGAGKGIGRAVALRFAREGRTVAASARTEADLDALAREAAGMPGLILPVPLDITDAAAAERAVQDIEASTGHIGLAILNAGTHVPEHAEGFDLGAFEKVVAVNLISTAKCLAAILPPMLQRRAGRIAVVSSVAGYRGLPSAAAYGATKAALINLAESLAPEMAGKGVTMTLINPGFVDTPLTRKNDFPMPFLISAEDAADRLRDGVRVVIAGPPNRGKSSLFNALIGEGAAIVSSVAGTTRDAIERPVAFGGVPFVLVDTAGLRDEAAEEIEAIGVERDLAGMPMAYAPAEWFLDGEHSDQLRKVRDLVTKARRNEVDGALLPSIFDQNNNRLLEFSLLSAPGSRQLDTGGIIQRYSTAIATSMLQDFLTLGHESVGSFALGKAKISLWQLVVESIAKSVTEVVNKHAIPRLMRLNGWEPDRTPRLDYGNVVEEDLSILGEFLVSMVEAGIIVPDARLEAYMRDLAQLPVAGVEVFDDSEETTPRVTPTEPMPPTVEPVQEPTITEPVVSTETITSTEPA